MSSDVSRREFLATVAAALLCAGLAIVLALLSFITIWRHGLTGSATPGSPPSLARRARLANETFTEA